MNRLNYTPQNMLISVRPDQNKTLERIKFESIQKEMKTPKSEIIRTALDVLFEKSIDEILELLYQRANGLQ